MKTSDSTPDRDGRSRDARTSVLPTLISSSPGKSPAPSQQRPANRRPLPQPTSALICPAQRQLSSALPNVSSTTPLPQTSPQVPRLSTWLPSVEEPPGGEVIRGFPGGKERFCHECGHNVSPGAKFCSSCGAELDTFQSAHSSLQEENQHIDGDRKGADMGHTRGDKQKASRTANRLEGESKQQFLDFKKSFKKERILKATGHLPARMKEVMVDLFYPQTPDVSQMLKRSMPVSRSMSNPEPIIFPHERALYKCFLKFRRGSSLEVPKESKNQGSASEDELGSRPSSPDDEEAKEAGPKAENVIDMRSFIPFMKKLRLIPPQKHGDRIPCQYAVAVHCFNWLQEQGRQRTLQFPECKEVIHQFLRTGPEFLQRQLENKQAEILEMHHKIARMVPNCDEPLAVLKRSFSQLFDSIFDAFIFFDVSGDWNCTKVEFIQYCKMLQLPLTPADIESILKDLQLEELDALGFVKHFKWYALVEKPHYRVMGYTVTPAENKLYQVFSWLAAGYGADRVFQIIYEEDQRLHRLFLEQSELQAKAEANGQKEGKEEELDVIDEGHSPVPDPFAEASKKLYTLHTLEEVDCSSPLPAVVRKASESEEPSGGEQIRDNDAGAGKEGEARGRKKQEPENLFRAQKTKIVTDSSERQMNFQSFIEFLKVEDLIPIHLHRPGGKMKADLSSIEFAEALRIFRSTLVKEKRLEWPEFKECLHELLTSKNLERELHSAELQLMSLRTALARFAPSSDDPLEEFKDALSVRFDSAVEAFVFFDIQGDWAVTQAEVQNMIKRLMLPLSKPDIESALQAIFIASHGGGINSLEFVRRLKWSQDDTTKVKEVFDLYANEKRLFNDFKRWCDIEGLDANTPGKDTPLSTGTPGARRRNSAAVVHEVEDLQILDGGRGATGKGSRVGTSTTSRMGTAASRPMTNAGEPEAISRLNTGIEMSAFAGDNESPEVRNVSCTKRMPFAGFEGFLRAFKVMKAGSSVEELELELARKAFETVNWSEDKDNVISWVEFKHVLHTFFINITEWLQPHLKKYQSEVGRKRMELHQKVITLTDPIRQFSQMLALRFDDVFEAFVFFDVDGDWNVTNKEMHKMLLKLRLNMTRADLDLVIAKVMHEKDTKSEILCDPKLFSKTLAWHPKPATAPALRRALDLAKEHRAQVVEKALARANADATFKDLNDGAENLSILPADAAIVAHLAKQIQDIETLQRDFGRIKTFFGIPFDGRLALSEDDIQRRRSVANFVMQKRALQSSDKGLSVLLDRARLKRHEIEAKAIKRSQDDVYARKLQGFKEGGAKAPPEAEVLLKWIGKTDRVELAAAVQRVNGIKAAILRFQCHGKFVFNLHVNRMAMSTKERLKRQEMFAHNRDMKKLAVEGEHQIITDGLDEAKLRRRSITELAIQRAEVLQVTEWANIEFPSKSVVEAFGWFKETARLRVLEKKKLDSIRSKVSPQVSPQASPRRPVEISRTSSLQCGIMDGNRILESSLLMTTALEYRFGTVYDAWCFFDPEAKWGVSAEEFRKKALLLLPEETVDIEGVIRKLDPSGQDSLGPLDFVNALKWHDLPAGGAGEMRASFDAAAKRRKVAAEVALRRSRVPKNKRLLNEMAAGEEVAAEDERQRKDMIQKRAAESAAKRRRLRELFGPPQMFKDFARQRDWKRLLELEVDVLRISLAMHEMRAKSENTVLGVTCDELSLEYYQRISPLYEIPAEERDAAATLIQRSLRAFSAWRNNDNLKSLRRSNREIWGFGRGEPRSYTIQALRSNALDCGFVLYDQNESYADLGTAQVLAVDVVISPEERVRAELAAAVEKMKELEHWAISEMKINSGKAVDLEVYNYMILESNKHSKLGENGILDNQSVLIRYTIEAAVSLLVGEEALAWAADSLEWNYFTKVLSAPNFKRRILQYEVDYQDDRYFRHLLKQDKYAKSILHPAFPPKHVGKAAEGLCTWVRAVCAYKQYFFMQQNYANFSFEMVDADGDGFITRDEYNEVFSILDKNMDGKISSDEWDCVSFAPFHKLDTDGDGFLTFEEFQAGFDMFDLNHDGLLSKKEFTSALIEF